MFAPFSYARPETIDEALKLLPVANTSLYSGGTDLLTCMREQLFPVDRVVSLSGVAGLSGIEEAGKTLRIGAMTTLAELADSQLLRERYPALAQAAASAASPQIRNQGTIGGNVCQNSRCWYYRGEFHCIRKGGPECYAYSGDNRYHCIFGGANCFMVHPSDPLPALAALGAGIVVLGPEGERRIEAEDFAMPPSEDPTAATRLGSQEVVTAVELPGWAAGTYSAYRKVRARRSWDFSLAGMATVIETQGGAVHRVRVVFSGVAPVPWRSKAVEKVVVENGLDPASIEKAAEAAVADAKPLEHNAYKVQLLQGVIREELALAAERLRG